LAGWVSAKVTVAVQSPTVGGRNTHRHTFPDTAELSDALPSAAKYPGTVTRRTAGRGEGTDSPNRPSSVVVENKMSNR